MRRIVLLATAAVAVAALLSGCGVANPTSAPLTPNDGPIAPTPWPNGTTGACGLRISPSLLYGMPLSVGGSPLVEDVQMELQALDDRNYCAGLAAYYAARVNDIADPNWLVVTFEQLKEGAQDATYYASWRDGWFLVACSQAEGLGTTEVQTINSWQVDVGHCKGGVDAYVVDLGSGLLVSAMDLGPRRLGRQLIAAIN